MSLSTIKDIVDRLSKTPEDQVCQVDVDFIFPITASSLAALVIQAGPGKIVLNHSTAGGQSYARNLGLVDVIEGKHNSAQRLTASGSDSYSRLMTISNHSDVEPSNTALNNVIAHNLSDFPPQFVAMIRKVVGELNDNVASHACATGFSTAQVYSRPSRRLEIAFSDSGCGLLSNVRKIEKSIQSDCDAIRWCLEKGNTSCPSPPVTDLFGPQRGAGMASLHDQTGGIGNDDHHMGLGLHHLMELLKVADGDLWIWSGNGCFTMDRHNSQNFETINQEWTGTNIHIVLYLDENRVNMLENEERAVRLKALANELGI